MQPHDIEAINSVRQSIMNIMSRPESLEYAAINVARSWQIEPWRLQVDSERVAKAIESAGIKPVWRHTISNQWGAHLESSLFEIPFGPGRDDMINRILRVLDDIAPEGVGYVDTQ